MAKISITRALTRIKIIEVQLGELVNEVYVKTVLEKDKDTDRAKLFREQSKSNFDKFNSLYNELIKLKKLIRLENEKTVVKICGKEMTVSEVLIQKGSLFYKKELLESISNKSRLLEMDIERANALVEKKAQDFVKALNIEDKADLDKMLEVGRSTATKETKSIIATGINLDKVLKDDLEFVKEFLNEVDYVLSESNAMTLIDV